MHHCEERFADALQLSASERDEIVLQTKCGIVPAQGMFDFSYDHIVGQVEGSLRALRTDRLDVLLLHRPDILVEPQEVARAFDDLEAAGKVRAFGVSNHTPRQIDLLRTAVRQPLVANQLQLSLTHAPILAQPVAANMAAHEQSVVRDGGGIVEYCRINGITIQAWSPFQDGFSHGVFLGNPAYAELNEVIDRLAAAHDVTPLAIATAWITRHPAGMQVVLGTTTPQRVRDAAAGADLELSRPEWYELFRVAGHLLP
jgi:predicted oxidoreductase